MPQATRDFGAPRKGGEGVRFTAPVIVGAVAACALAVTIWSIRQQSHEIAQTTVETQAQDIVGPPCRPVMRAAFAQPLQPVNVLDFDGVGFGRRFGEADCSAIAAKSLLGNGYQLVCQFSSPAVLSVKSDKGMFYFEPGPGRVATLFVLDGAPRCVLASPYFARWKRAVTETDAQGRPTFAKTE
jgi:hypothetical protein